MSNGGRFSINDAKRFRYSAEQTNEKKRFGYWHCCPKEDTSRALHSLPKRVEVVGPKVLGYARHIVRDALSYCAAEEETFREEIFPKTYNEFSSGNLYGIFVAERRTGTVNANE